MSRRIRYQDDDNDDQGLFTNRSTMMANFEEWIKMATDNKINSKNSWNFALIDYFHDLNVLRDSENNINFQKASATLDGCVKIYSSRVDSVTTETGKLLSGLAQKKNTTKSSSSGNPDDSEVDGIGGRSDGADDDIHIDPLTGLPISNDTDAQSKRRTFNRVLETTLVDFEAIRLKELDQELNIDPLFKKALVDFDEGGAKSLLLNALNIDNTARVVFDTAIKDEKDVNESKLELLEREESGEEDSENDESKEDDLEKQNQLQEDSREEPRDHDISKNEEMNSKSSDLIGEEFANCSVLIEDEILSLGIDYIKFNEINHCEISPSIQQLRNVVEDITKAKNFIDGVSNKFDNFLSEQELQEVVPDGGLDDVNSEKGDLQDEFSYISHKENDDEDVENPREGDLDGVDPLTSAETSSMDGNAGTIEGIFEQDLMAYFDESLKRNWRGREHWKVRNLKKNSMLSENINSLNNNSSRQSLNAGTSKNDPATKKKKKQTELDFFALDDQLEETIFGSKKRTNIDLPLKFRKDESHYLLPDDYQFSTQKITRLFIKPGQSMSLFNRRRRLDSLSMSHEKDPDRNGPSVDEPVAIADEHFWAENYERKEKEEEEEGKENLDQEEIKNGKMNNPFNDDEDIGVDFNQAFEEEEFKDDSLNSYPADEPEKLPLGENKVNYSRVSKKVDVRKLKNNLWRTIKTLVERTKEGDEIRADTDCEPVIQLKFTDITREISKMYSNEARKDISTSFCFICLLHLANEYGLQIINAQNYDDLIIFYGLQTKESV